MKIQILFYLKIMIMILISNVKNTSISLSSKKEYCIYKDFKLNDSIKLTYIVSGENELNVVSKVVGPSNTIYDNSQSNSGDFFHDVITEGTYKLCFISSSPNNNISFEFSSKDEGGYVVNLAKEGLILLILGVFSGMNKNITDISLLFEQIEDQLKHLQTRKLAHNNSNLFYNNLVISNLMDSIKQYTIYKLLIILCVSLFQIYIIRKYFENKKVDIKFTNPFNDARI